MRSENCEECDGRLPQDPPTLTYGKDSKLGFCSERCRHDYLDGLPEGSSILERHENTTDVTPWNLR